MPRLYWLKPWQHVGYSICYSTKMGIVYSFCHENWPGPGWHSWSRWLKWLMCENFSSLVWFMFDWPWIDISCHLMKTHIQITIVWICLDMKIGCHTLLLIWMLYKQHQLSICVLGRERSSNKHWDHSWIDMFPPGVGVFRWISWSSPFNGILLMFNDT